jgi:hypothetical protein
MEHPMLVKSVPALRASFVTALLAVVAFAPGAFAQDAEAPVAQWDGFTGTACEAEFKANCEKNGTSESSSYSCLRGVHKQGLLSAACSEVTEKMRQERVAIAAARQAMWMEACAEDMVKHCAEFADAKPAARTGCLGRKRGQLSEACEAKLPIRPGLTDTNARARWRDGTEPEDWALQNALRDRPRKTQGEIDEIGRDAWIARDNARRAKKIADGKKRRAAAAAEAAAE